MENAYGEVVEESKQIIEVYQNFYKDLLSGRLPQNNGEMEIEQEVNRYIKALEIKVQRNIIRPFSMEKYQNMKKELKK